MPTGRCDFEALPTFGACADEQCRSDISIKNVPSACARRGVDAPPTLSTSSADVRSPVIAAPVGGFELTGAVGGWIDPGVAPVHPGRGEFEEVTSISPLPPPRFPSCRFGLCDPLVCMCECNSETRYLFEAMCRRV